MKLENKTIIVTGGGRGIGRYIAKRLEEEGANIVVTARTEEDVKKVINAAVEKFGKIDVLVNNAGAGIRMGNNGARVRRSNERECKRRFPLHEARHP